MHGLINRAFQSFLSDSFGEEAWQSIVAGAGIGHHLGPDGFEAMHSYPDDVTEAVLNAAVTQLKRSRESLLEDMGTYLISHERMEPLRRLLRFGGVSFTDFLFSLDDLHGRSVLAVPDLRLPNLSVLEVGAGHFTLSCKGCRGVGYVVLGIIRAMADDYGALAVLDHKGDDESGHETLDIAVHDPAFHAGRRFELAAGAV